MRKHRRWWSVAGTSIGVLALFNAGCATLDFALGRPTAAPAAPTVTAPAAPAALVPAAPPANGSVQANKPGLPPPPGPPDAIMQAAYGSPGQALSMLSQKLAAAEDERKVLVARLHLLESLLESRDQALAASAREIDATQAEILKTRSEIERWKRDMTKMREQMRTVEKENLGTLESIINMLEQVVENDKEPGPPRPATGAPGKPTTGLRKNP